ncbi:7TM diverse intracellular signaling domain-containing protein [Leptospira sp. 'Mane']|uniref:7TM diverse intracellular signaling domain-containing protein n=1 Tax=Leptospira sp. 'Mane' TaxID=3387407 RepID=UPI00398B2BFB
MPLLFLVIFSFFISCLQISLKPSPKIESGVLDLRKWNLSSDGSVVLKGDSAFYWEEFLFPEDFQKKDSEKTKEVLNFKYIPSVWNGSLINGKKIAGHGYATFRFKILLNPDDTKDLALKLADQGHAYRMFLNGKLVLESGVVARTKEEMIPEMKPTVFRFAAVGPEQDFIFHVSNFHHRVGGLRYEIKLGAEDRILEERQASYIIESFLYGGFFIIALYHFAIYSFRRKNPTTVYFGGFCIAVLFYSAVTGERLLYHYLPDLFDWNLKYKIEFIMISLITVSFSLFFAELYQEDKSKWRYILKSVIGINLSFIVFTLFTEPVIFTELLNFVDLSRIVLSCYVLYGLFLSIRQKKEGSVLFLMAILFVFVCGINDSLSGRSIIHTPRVLSYGLTAMILLQAIMLAKIFTKDFLTAEILTTSLSQTNLAYSRFVPTEFLNLLEKKSILDIHLGDHVQREMTVLFSDIRSYTTMSEKMSPSENFQFVNSYLNKIAPVIESNHGFIDKYIGDAIMGLFPGDADNAIQASISIQKEIGKYNLSRKDLGTNPLKVGIGLHTGNLILGTIGHNERMEGTVVSDSVNLASRIEGLTKYYGSNILISEDTFHALKDPKKYNVRLLDNVMVTGKETSIFVIEILDGYDKEDLDKFLNTKKDFEIGHILYKEKAFNASIDFFKKVLKANPIDSACAFYLKRAEFYDEHGAPPEWEGIEVFAEK